MSQRKGSGEYHGQFQSHSASLRCRNCYLLKWRTCRSWWISATLGNIARQIYVLISFFTAYKRSLGQDNVFTHVCHSVHGVGGLGSQHASLVTWQGALHPGIRGSASSRKGVCIQQEGSLHPGGRGLHLGRSSHPPDTGYYGIRSTSCQYASYWNAFLLLSTYEV